jgi:hypothetical protein
MEAAASYPTWNARASVEVREGDHNFFKEKLSQITLHNPPFALHNFCTNKKYLWRNLKGDIA